MTHDATAEEMKRAYRKVTLASHPDKPGGSEEAFSRVSAAYKVLARLTVRLARLTVRLARLARRLALIATPSAP